MAPPAAVRPSPPAQESAGPGTREAGGGVLVRRTGDPEGGGAETVTRGRGGGEEGAVAEGNPHEPLAFSGRAMVTRSTLT